MHTIIGLGEVLWDVFDDGKVLGGAPCNMAYHVCALGHRGVPLSRVGRDALGDDLLASLRSLGLPTELIQRDPAHPTGTVLVKVDAAGAPDFTIVQDVAWDYMEAGGDWLRAAGAAHAVCFGTLAQRSPVSRAAVRRVLDAAAAAGALIVCDVNFRQSYYSREVVEDSLARSAVVKLNQDEVAALRGLLGGPQDEGAFARALMAGCGARLVCVTRGAGGCTLYGPGESVSAPVPATRVVDTVGSGDAFTAALVIKYLDGRPLETLARAANLMGAFVAGRRGATPQIPPQVAERFAAL
jgi:fructokinase